MANRSAITVNLLAIFFIVLGIVWISCIRIRCEEISPWPVISKAVSISSTTVDVPQVKKVRSPHAKPYYDIVFKAICSVEVFVAIFYILAGIFLFKRYVLAKVIVIGVLTADIFFKTAVIFFMKLATIPLSQLTHNPNLLQLYFMPSTKAHNFFSAIFSGLQLYLPGGLFYFVCEIIYFGVCFYLFSREEIKSFLINSKKV